MERSPNDGNGFVTSVLLRLAAVGRATGPRSALAVGTVLAVSLAGGWSLVHAMNGTTSPFPHVMYVPVIVASFAFGVRGGLAVAALAGVLMGPLMPLNVDLGLQQTPTNMLYRTGFYLLVGAVSGAFAESARAYTGRLLAAHTELTRMSGRNLHLFARLIADRDEQTGGHCERVAQNAVTVARALGIEEPELRLYYWGGLLHDLGKLGVPEAILTKPGRLTAEEFAEIRKHPAFGERILLDISPAFAAIGQGVRSHHERWDGRGYPDGLEGTAIPLIGRVLAVVDVFEAVTSRRPYRDPMTVAEARSLVAADSGIHFDPRVVSTFLELEAGGEIARESRPKDASPDPAVFDPRTVFRTLN